MTNKLEILPCPFCGSEECSPNYHNARVWVDCNSCGVRGQTVSSKWIAEERGPSIEEAISLWNKRAVPVVEPVPPLIQTLHANGDGAAVVERQEPVAVVPEGWRLVPLNPTSSMLEAGKDERMDCFTNHSLSVEGALTRIYSAIIDAAPAYLDKLKELIPPNTTALNSMRDFANAMIDIALEGADADGGHIQELAIKHGLLKPEQRTERCGDSCSCAEYADFPVECFRKVKELNQ